jgi:hypothetical protein
MLEKVEKLIEKKWTEEDYEMVKQAGITLGYPVVNIGRNKENAIYAKTSSGKESWEKHMDLRLKNDEGSQDWFMLFVEAIQREDYVKEEIQK